MKEFIKFRLKRDTTFDLLVNVDNIKWINKHDDGEVGLLMRGDNTMYLVIEPSYEVLIRKLAR